MRGADQISTEPIKDSDIVIVTEQMEADALHQINEECRKYGKGFLAA